MIEICAWCKCILDWEDPKDDEKPTHGICPDCADLLKKKYKMSAALDSHDIEVLINHLAKTPGA